MNIENQVAIVTGAGSGIGRQVTETLLEAGFFVVLAGRSKASLEATIAMASDWEHQALAVPTDVTSCDSVKNLFDSTVDRFGRVDLLFNNAGINLPTCPIEEIRLEDWQRVVDTNLTGMFLCIQQAVKQMKAQSPAGGRIINNGSISAHVPRPGSAAYTATKHAVTGLTKSTNLDCRRFGIAVGQIDIGNAHTDMTARMEKGVPQADGGMAVEPTIDALDVAKAVLYMAKLPRGCNVPFMTVMATEMPYAGRG